MTFFGERGDWAASLPARTAHDGHAHATTTTATATATTAARIAAGHAGPARRAGARRGLSPASRSATGSSARGFEGFWKHVAVPRPGQHILEEMEHVPALVSLSPTLMMARRLRGRLLLVHRRPAAPEALADANPAALPLPAQQVVLRRALRLPVRPPGVLASAALFWKGGDGAIIDGFGPDGVSARVLDVDPRRRAAADRLRLSLRLRDAARRRRVRDLVPVRGESADVRLLDPLGPAGPAAGRRAADPAAARRERGDARATRAGSRCGRR